MSTRKTRSSDQHYLSTIVSTKWIVIEVIWQEIIARISYPVLGSMETNVLLMDTTAAYCSVWTKTFGYQLEAFKILKFTVQLINFKAISCTIKEINCKYQNAKHLNEKAFVTKATNS